MRMSLQSVFYAEDVRRVLWGERPASAACPSPKLRPAGKWLIFQVGSGDNLSSMVTILLHMLRLVPFLCCGRRQLALENLALRQQLAVYKRTVPRPRLRRSDRLWWVWLARVWTGWRQSLVIVTPGTVLRWQRRRVREHGTKLSGRPPRGRPPVSAEIRALVSRMAAANPLGGAPRIPGELLKVGIDVADRIVSRLRRMLGREFLRRGAGSFRTGWGLVRPRRPEPVSDRRPADGSTSAPEG
jgi:hypothetical protein